MKKKLLILTALCLQMLLGGTLKAQDRFEVTLSAGLNMGQIDGDQAGRYSHPGLRAGLGTSFALTKATDGPWRMVVELAYTSKGSHNSEYNTSLEADYVEVPLMIAYECMEGRLRISAGVAPAVKVRSAMKYGARPTTCGRTFSPRWTGCR